MKNFVIIILAFIPSYLLAQKLIAPTDHFIIDGKVKKPLTVSLNDAAAFPVVFKDSVMITNHLHERKGVMKNMKGVLLKDILTGVEIDVENPKLLSEFYIICIASDNYKVVFSWNEIFNTDTGKNVYILIGHDDKAATLSDDRIALISPNDYTTGRRYVKGLQKIVIERVQ